MKKKFFILFSIFFFLFSHRASAATLFSQAANQDTYEGQTFVLDWYLDTENQSVNVVNLNLKFSTSNLEVVDANLGNSLLNLWIKNPTADNQNGTVSLIGGVTNGISNNKVPIFRTTFRAKTSGSAFIDLDPSSQVLLNDGRGTNTSLKFKNIAFNIYPKDFIPVAIHSSTHPDQNTWYPNHDVAISFEPKPDTIYSYGLSSNQEIIPDNTQDTVPTEITYPNRPDGIYYFKLNSKTATGNWQEAGVYRVQIDSTPPEDFVPQVGTEAGKKFVSFSTVDKTSGISHYKVKFGWWGKQNSTENPYFEIPKFFLGNQIQITAVDNAGNMRWVTIKYKVYPDWLFYLCLVLITVGLLGIVAKLKKQKNGT